MHGDLTSKYILIVICAITTLGLANSVSAQDITNESLMNQTTMQMSAPETLSELDTDLGNNSQILENDTGPATVQSPPSGINWGELCRNSAVDPLIREPCSTLTTPDGFSLTNEGQRVLWCLLAGGLGQRLGLSDEELSAAAPAFDCGPSRYD